MIKLLTSSLGSTYPEGRIMGSQDRQIHGFHHFACNREREFLIMLSNLWIHNLSGFGANYFLKMGLQVFDGFHQRTWWNTYGRVCKVAERIP